MSVNPVFNGHYFSILSDNLAQPFDHELIRID